MTCAVFSLSSIGLSSCYGTAFLAMGLYSTIGRATGMSGTVTKFMITGYSRYLGLVYHVLSSVFALWMLKEGYDYIYPAVHIVASVLLEMRYTALGFEAVRYIDPDWSQADNDEMLYPFNV